MSLKLGYYHFPRFNRPSHFVSISPRASCEMFSKFLFSDDLLSAKSRQSWCLRSNRRERSEKYEVGVDDLVESLSANNNRENINLIDEQLSAEKIRKILGINEFYTLRGEQSGKSHWNREACFNHFSTTASFHHRCDLSSGMASIRMCALCFPPINLSGKLIIHKIMSLIN